MGWRGGGCPGGDVCGPAGTARGRGRVPHGMSPSPHNECDTPQPLWGSRRRPLPPPPSVTKGPPRCWPGSPQAYSKHGVVGGGRGWSNAGEQRGSSAERKVSGGTSLLPLPHQWGPSLLGASPLWLGCTPKHGAGCGLQGSWAAPAVPRCSPPLAAPPASSQARSQPLVSEPGSPRSRGSCRRSSSSEWHSSTHAPPSPRSTVSVSAGRPTPCPTGVPWGLAAAWRWLPGGAGPREMLLL